MNDDREKSRRYDEYYSRMFEPYSADELALHYKDRWLKNHFEMMLAHVFSLMLLLDKWRKHLEEGGERPKTTFVEAFTPSSVGMNNAESLFSEICDLLPFYEHGETPKMPIISFVSRATITLIAQLKEFCPTEFIKAADVNFREFITLVAYHGKSRYGKDDFARLLREKSDLFMEACTKNAQELDEYVQRYGKAERPVVVKIAGEVVAKPDKQTRKAIDDIYTSAVEGKEVDDGRRMGRIRRKMVAEAADIKLGNDISCRSAAQIIIHKYDGVPGAYTKSEATAFVKAINRECRGAK